jgi:HSP20 family protein
MTFYRIPVPDMIRATLPTHTLRADMARAMEDVFSTRAEEFLPRADGRADATGFTIELDVPGISPEQIEVLAEDGVLSIRGERTARDQANREGASEERALIGERPQGRFERRFRLPKSADLNAITATYALGVLTVRVAKVAPAQPRRVPIAVDVAAPAVTSGTAA